MLASLVEPDATSLRLKSAKGNKGHLGSHQLASPERKKNVFITFIARKKRRADGSVFFQ